MKRTVFLIVIALTFFSIMSVRPAAADGFCASGTTKTDGTYHDVGTFFLTGGVHYTFSGSDSVPTGSIGFYGLINTDNAFSIDEVFPNNTLFTLLITGSNPFGSTISWSITTVGVPCPQQQSGLVTWFNPGDGRADPRPGDRLVVYCNIAQSPPNIAIFAVAPGGTGQQLAQMPTSDLLKPNFSLNQGVDGILTGAIDANNVGYISLTGGPYQATGVGDWAKTFNCLSK